MNTDDFGLAIGQKIIEKYHADTGRAAVFDLVGREWDLLHSVWPPAYSPGGERFAHLIPFGSMESFLEMGCGAGIMSVLAALGGCDRVVGLDINPAAVANTLLNAERHGVADAVEARESNMYSAVEPGERFDGIYWNPPFLEAPEELLDGSIWHETMFDPKFAKLGAFITGASELLTPTGRIYLWFGEAIGNPTLIENLARAHDFDLRLLHRLSLADEPSLLEESFLGRVVEELGDSVDSSEGDEWHLHLLELAPRNSA